MLNVFDLIYFIEQREDHFHPHWRWDNWKEYFGPLAWSCITSLECEFSRKLYGEVFFYKLAIGAEPWPATEHVAGRKYYLILRSDEMNRVYPFSPKDPEGQEKAVKAVFELFNDFRWPRLEQTVGEYTELDVEECASGDVKVSFPNLKGKHVLFTQESAGMVYLGHWEHLEDEFERIVRDVPECYEAFLIRRLQAQENYREILEQTEAKVAAVKAKMEEERA